ncbi:MAG: DUF3786 domain-containing protein [Bacillota bacterium]
MDAYIPGNYQGAISRSLEIFAKADPQDMVLGSGAVYDKTACLFRLRYCGQDIEVCYPSGDAWWLKPQRERISVKDQYLILLYLAQASGLPARNRWLTFLELPGGPHHYVPFIKEAIEPLLKAFGSEPEKAWAAARELGAQKAAMGDVGFVAPVFPKLHLGFVFWQGEDEFPSKANILFDEVSITYLDTASLYMLGINTSLKILKASKEACPGS